MGLEIIIRPPKEEERDRFYEVFQSGLPGVDPMTAKDFSEWWTEGIKRGSVQKFWRVAEVENQIVGIVINFIHEPYKWGILWELSVLPKWRDKSIGTRLIEESEKILLNSEKTLTDFALGMKIQNHKALRLYERLGYGIRYLVLKFIGTVWDSTDVDNFDAQKSTPDQISHFLSLLPSAYWSKRSQESWSRISKRPQSFTVISKQDSKIIGHFLLFPDEEEEQATSIDISFLPNFGIDVLNLAIRHVKDKKAAIWIQDCYQDIIEYLYTKQFKRVDCEYLLKKKIYRTMI
ncbi:MAG: GNAT family N-acetyltransferase [Promethearchaeota archaeon]